MDHATIYHSLPFPFVYYGVPDSYVPSVSHWEVHFDGVRGLGFEQAVPELAQYLVEAV